MTRFVLAASIVGLLAAPAALAQAVNTTAAQPLAPAADNTPGAQRARKTTKAPVPQLPHSATVLGVPVTVDAPVSPPYAGDAYRTLGGQPETGADDIAGQSQPSDLPPHSD